MQCQACHSDNATGELVCRSCGATLAGSGDITPIREESATITEIPGTAWSRPYSTATRNIASITQLAVGTILGERYEILALLGEGGMGAVYKARDREVGHFVALKVIRPELANQQVILNRFKQELILARQITHKNVIRIFDLGQAEGIKFITMEFVEGRDLHSLLKAGRTFTITEKVRIIQQVCRALDAAHAEGVVHRDLKPHNIMVEESGRIVVMDFGIARSMEGTGGQTSTGALLGTPAYMSPEQAKGEKVDTRSDLFSLGIIFYELLTGVAPYESETMVGLLLKRIQERPIPPVERDPEIPQGLSDVVLKCLAVDLTQRYQTAHEVLQDLTAWQGAPDTFRTVAGTLAMPTVTQPSGPVTPVAAAPAPKQKLWKWVGAACILAILAAAGFFMKDRFISKPATAHAPVTVMIADFNNHTGDPIFDGTLESTLRLALEGAGFISAYDRTKLRDLGVAPVEKLDDQSAAKIALSQGLGVVVYGSLQPQGTGYGLALRAVQAVTGSAVANGEETAANKDQVLFALTKAASTIRKGLGDATTDSAQRFAMDTLTATSLEAVHEYAQAMEAIANGKNADAFKGFSKAADVDPNFGLAYAGMAMASRNMDKHEDAVKYIREAQQHIDRMTERERYRTRGSFYFITDDYQKCTDEYGALIARYSADVAALNNLGACYASLRNIPKALEEMARATEILPKKATYRFNHALYQAYLGNFPAAETEVQAALRMNPTYEKGFMTLAYSQLGQNHLDQAEATYRNLEKTGPTGASMAANGFADIAVYEGRFNDAVRILDRGSQADVASGQMDAAADKYLALAHVQSLREQKAPAVAAAQKALDLSTEVKTRFLAARAFMVAGDTAKAKTLASGLAKEILAEPQAYAKLIDGEIALKGGDARTAVQDFVNANILLDTWIGHFDLGRAYLEVPAFTDADSEFDRCVKRRGEAMELFMDDVPTFGYYPAIYYYQGRVREGLKTAGYADSYRTYLDIRGKAGEDPLLNEIRRRIQ
jgi:tetratricopeptide (TPR) repeat protein/predicted Ser/Thr protein kinase